MPDNPSIFNNVYALQLVSGQYLLASSTASGSNVTVKDDINDGGGDVHSLIGDIANDHFDVLSSGSLNGGYTFVTVAQFGGASGFIAEDSSGNFVFFTNDTVTPAQVGTPATPQAGPVSVCFMPGTMVRTPHGEAAVEHLRIGDLVQSVDGKPVAIRWIGRQTVAPRFADELRLPIRIRAGAIGENVPCRDLLLSPDHAVFIDGALIHAGALVNDTSIVRERRVPTMFIYYHIEVDGHALIAAENTPAETFIDNVDRHRFDNWAEYEALYPSGKAIEELPYPRAKAARQVPSQTRERLANRARALYGRTSQAA
jgi:hypothetical protein